MEIKIKPLSVNRCWQGRRFKTPEYKQYEKDVNILIDECRKWDNIRIPKGKKLKVIYIFGVSNMNCDWDNPIKPFQDILQKKYGFNDRDIVCAKVIKEKVEKGEEFIWFDIKEDK